MPMRETLTLLHTLYPVQGWVYVGAGNGNFLEQVVLTPAPALLAIEADKALYTQLVAKIEQHPQSQALHQLIGGQDEAVPFYRHSSPKENGLLSAALLTPLWKNLRQREAITTPAQTLHRILTSVGESGARYNWLTLACLPALPLLQGLGPRLQQFDVLQARVTLTDDTALAKAGASRPAVDAWLQTQGFKPLLVQEEINAQLASVLYVRDWKTQATQTNQALTLAHQSKIEILQQEKTALAQAHEQQSKLAAECQTKIEALDKEKSELIAARDALSQEKAALMQACNTEAKAKAELLQEHQLLIQTQKALEADLAQNRKALADAQAAHDTAQAQQREQEFLQLQAGLQKQADELIRVRKFLGSSLKKEVTNATKQIEASIGLQSYFATGELPNINTESHSWPISPDFALYLIELIELNDYDLIIEFGSGISTAIIAKTLAKSTSKRIGKPPVDFISFDHLEKYYQRTLTQLEHAGLAETVQLNLAPLQDWLAPNGNTYPYYTCQPTLAALAQKHPAAGLRLLVIVDGPPAATGKHARYPAGPLILQHFADAHIDLLLDDYIRDDEKEIAKLWQADIAAAKLIHTTTERKLEKDACLIAISNAKENP